MTKPKTILGIDPGTVIMGYGLISADKKEMHLVTLGVLKLQKFPDPYIRLGMIQERIKSLIETYHPDEVALEAPFYGKNVQSMLKLGRAQGVAMAPALMKGIPVFEYAPRRIKQSITGNGNASKEQVATMVQQILKFREEPKYLDATDGLAVALCHCFQGQKTETHSKSSTWAQFIRNNPDRIR